MHVGRAFVDRANLRVAEQLGYGIVFGVSHPAEEIDAFRREPHRHLGGVVLRHGPGCHEVLPAVLQASGVPDHQPRGLELRHEFGNLKLNALELGETLAELPALLDIPQRVPESPFRDPDHLRSDRDTALVQRLDRDSVAVANLAYDVLSGYLAVIEEQLAGRRRPDPELVFFLANAEAWSVPFDQEGRDAPMARAGLGIRENQEQARFLGVGDPQFASVDDERVALSLCPRLHGERIAP